jgi:hypothetical protein
MAIVRLTVGELRARLNQFDDAWPLEIIVGGVYANVTDTYLDDRDGVVVIDGVEHGEEIDDEDEPAPTASTLS